MSNNIITNFFVAFRAYRLANIWQVIIYRPAHSEQKNCSILMRRHFASIRNCAKFSLNAAQRTCTTFLLETRRIATQFCLAVSILFNIIQSSLWHTQIKSEVRFTVAFNVTANMFSRHFSFAAVHVSLGLTTCWTWYSVPLIYTPFFADSTLKTGWKISQWCSLCFWLKIHRKNL